MQKLDFVRNLEYIVNNLKIEEFVKHFEEGFRTPTSNFPYNNVRPLLFAVKSYFDNMYEHSQYSEILKTFNAFSIYGAENLSNISTALGTFEAHAVFGKKILLEFYNFNKTILATYTLAREVLLSDELDEDLDLNLDKGILIFQIVINGDSLTTETYIKIFSAIQELATIVGKIFGTDDEKVEVILLDSGSDTNIGIKAGIDTAKSLFLIFKEVWTFMISHKHYRNSENNKTLLESLTIREEIQKKLANNVITAEEAKEYVHLIKNRTDDLIGLKVIPKQLVEENEILDNKKLLSEFEGTRLLSE